MATYQGNADFIAVCFDPDDREIAEQIIARLDAGHLRVWSGSRGCNIQKKNDAARLAACRTALIIISQNWLADGKCTPQLRFAAEHELQTVLLFTDDADLSTNEELRLLLSRSVRMLDYRAESAEECFAELLSLECVQDCKMRDGEQPDEEKPGLFGFLKR